MEQEGSSSSEPEDGTETLGFGVGTPSCTACGTVMAPKTSEGEWFWGCPKFPECRGPTKKKPPVPEPLREAVRKSWKVKAREAEQASAEGDFF